MDAPRISPDDQYNRQLVAHAHPAEWKNPKSAGVYNLVVIGGGTAGIISALGAAGLGGKVALVERHLLGGDCLNYGCVPSKSLLSAARMAYDARRAEQFGVSLPGGVAVDFAAVMQRMRRLRARISQHDSAQRFAGLHVDVLFGDARFVDRSTIRVGDQTLRFRRCILATGSSPALPRMPGLEEVGYDTTETIFSLSDLPRRLLIIGGGPIGCELGQAFRRFGSEVMLVNRGPRLLSKEEPEAAALVQRQLESEGVQVRNNAQVKRFEKVVVRAVEQQQAVLDVAGQSEIALFDRVLVATGRRPRVEGLHLDDAGVRYSDAGIEVNDFLRTSNPSVFAAGDCIGGPQFTHAADAMARACLQNAFFFGRQRLSQMVIPRTTYTDPAIASIGLTAQDCAQQKIAITTFQQSLGMVDRAVLDSESDGFGVLHCRRGTSQVIGATIVARHAGEMMGELSLLMTNRMSLAALAKTIHCYPTQIELLKRLADQYTRSRLTPSVGRWLKWILQNR